MPFDANAAHAHIDRVIKDHNAFLRSMVARHDILQGMVKDPAYAITRDSHLNQLRSRLQRDGELTRDAKEAYQTIDSDIAQVLQSLHELNTPFGKEKAIINGKEVTLQEAIRFFKAWHDFVKVMQTHLDTIHERMKQEEAFLKNPTLDTFKAFLAAWDQESMEFEIMADDTERIERTTKRSVGTRERLKAIALTLSSGAIGGSALAFMAKASSIDAKYSIAGTVYGVAFWAMLGGLIWTFTTFRQRAIAQSRADRELTAQMRHKLASKA